MEEALLLLVSFPTVIWTTMMVVILGYWGLVIVGAMGIDVFPGDGEFEADGLEGVQGGGGLSGLSQALSLGQVPVTVVVSLLTFKAWVLSIFAQWLLMPLVSGAVLMIILGVGLLLGSSLVAVWLTTFSARPLRPMFRVHTIRGGSHLIGGEVNITSSRVSDRFGTALYQVPDQDGQELLLNVVCDVANDLSTGATAVITDYDAQCGTFTVRPLPRVPSSLEDNSRAGA